MKIGLKTRHIAEELNIDGWILVYTRTAEKWNIEYGKEQERII